MSFELKNYLQEKAQRVEEHLGKLLPPETTRPTILHQAMHYSVFAGGKRLRPILCIAASEACNGKIENALTPGAAIELFHTFTLIHDDLPAMDDDDLRRGRPTCHIKYGEANAILAGDALHCLAFELLAKAEIPPPRNPSHYVLEVALAGGSQGVTGGQVEDMMAEGKTPSADLVDYIHTHKTADLFVAAIRLGGLAAGATDDQLQTLSNFARNIGIAFQITDDILDETASTECLGKPSGSDKEAGKMTYIAVHGMEKSRQDALSKISQAQEQLTTLRGDITPLNALAQHCIDRIN